MRSRFWKKAAIWIVVIGIASSIPYLFLICTNYSRTRTIAPFGGYPALWLAIIRERPIDEITRVIIRNPETMKFVGSGGLYPIHYSVLEGREDVLAVMLDQGANVDQRAIGDPEQYYAGNTALHFAVDFENLRMVEILMEAGANPDLPNPKGRSPRDLADIEGFREIGRALDQ